MTYEEFILVFLGGVGMMTLYIGAQALMTGEKVYRYYTAYALCWISYFFFKVTWTFSDVHIESVVYPFARIGFPMLAYVFYYRFADAFLDLRRLLPRIFWLFRWMEYVLLTYVVAELIICLFFNSWTNSLAHEWVHTVARLGVAVVSVYGITKAWGQRNQLVYYFVTGSALLLIFGLVSMALSFTSFSDDDRLVGPLFFLNIGILLELLCFSLGLSYKNKQTEIQKITIEQEVVREREQRELAQLKTQFFTNISHEFRTPLTLILGPLTDLLQKKPAYPTYQLMHRNASRLLTLVNQLLDLSKLDAGQLQPDIKPGNLTEWLRLLTGSFSSLAESRSIELAFLAQSNQFDLAYFDRDKVEKIVTNLLANALKFTPTGGSVVVQLSASATKQAIIQIQDTGIGIPTDQQARIFERFHQVAGNSSANVEGTGIGLALVRELVSVLSGSVSVESQVAQGTTFTVTLPVDADTWASSANSVIERTAEQNRINGNLPESELEAQGNSPEAVFDDSDANRIDLPLLLIIDDNADVRQYISQIMMPTYRIIEAVDGQDGLTKAADTIPDIVICDWMMPIMNGVEFCKILKTQSTTDHIPVIMLTAKAATENRIEGLSGGADDYLAKPFNPSELRVRVENLLTQRQKLRERFSRELYLKPTNVQVSSTEEVFLQNAIRIIEHHLSESSFSVEQLADELNLSRMQLHRKLKSLTNQSATEFVRDVRLQRAANLLAARSATVSEVAFTVGFESLSYFSKSFKEKYGVLPSDYEPITQLVSPTD
ncbi:response regulator [Spirosoma sp. HMF4905]|uniref:histidine kinase n=1 Tax=Spirosoma arboris TaxID=2682092 RepID=A0A7K1S7Y5_9BACT|nr:ATP-binding protein [Spirosoma arboris]MVM29860.1 response regulator [Spirosoma arboris]